jgi:RNA polymerase sigma-70 factor (ECF subfamily)
MLGISSAKDVADWDDAKILIAAQTQPWLFMVLVERYQDPFLRKAKRIIYNPLDAEEVVQDTFTKIYVHAHKYEPQSGASFSSWAYRILMNTAFTRYQKLVKEGQRFTNIDPEFEQFIGEQKEHSAFATERDGVERVLSRLPEHFAYVLRLHFLERWPQEDIARETGEKVGTIKARIHRAKAAFRKEASDEELGTLL